MTTEDAAAPPRLSFGTTFGAAFSSVFRKRVQFLKLAAVPLLLSIVILVADFSLRAMIFVGTLPLDPEGLVAALLELILGLLALLPLSFLGISLTRQSFAAPQSGMLPSPLLGRRTLVYTSFLLLLVVIFTVLAVVGFVGGIAVLQTMDVAEDIGVGAATVGGILGFSALVYLMLRVSLVLPAVALDERLGLLGSWRLTRKTGIKLAAVFLLLFLVAILAILIGSVVVGGGELRIGTPELVVPEGIGVGSDWRTIVMVNMPRNIWNLLANLIVFAMGCGAMASAYAQLTGWDKPRAEILETFE